MDRWNLSDSKLNKAIKAESELFNSSPQDRQAAMNLYRKGRNMGYTATHTDHKDINKFVKVSDTSHTDFKRVFNKKTGEFLNPDDAKKIYAANLLRQIDTNKARGKKVDPSSYILAKNLESGKNPGNTLEA